MERPVTVDPLTRFGTDSCPHMARFRSFVGVLSRLYGLEFALPVLSGSGEERLTQFKQFCSGLIERRTHLWRACLRQRGRKTWASVSMSLFLFRKTLPSKVPSVDDFMSKIGSPSGEPDPNFAEFVRRETQLLFKKGWDRGYAQACLSNSISTKSCYEKGRTFGGARQYFMSTIGEGNENLVDGRQAFVESLLVMSNCPDRLLSKVKIVPTQGKFRIVTVPQFELNKLRPLHTVLYDHLSRFSWCLRGDAKPARFQDFCYVEGEEFVSGDYESATDNLNQQIQKDILRLVLERCRSVPNGIMALAMKSLEMELEYWEDGQLVRSVSQMSGQMMGNLLSFPLLSLVNYLAFKYAIPRVGVPVRINGDDIVFRARPEECERWVEMIRGTGLVLSSGKTMRDCRYFSLNSSLFSARLKSKPFAVPIIRSTAVFGLSRDRDSIVTLKGRFRNAFQGGWSRRRLDELHVWWLKTNAGLINASRRSISRGLGLPVNLGVIMEAGLWDREAWYLSFVAEKALPSPFSQWMSRPDGWQYHRVEKVTKRDRARAGELAAAFVDAAWKPPRQDSEGDMWEDDLVAGNPVWACPRLPERIRLRRKARLLKVSVREVRRKLRPKRSLFDPHACRATMCSVWRPERPCLVSVGWEAVMRAWHDNSRTIDSLPEGVIVFRSAGYDFT